MSFQLIVSIQSCLNRQSTTVITLACEWDSLRSNVLWGSWYILWFCTSVAHNSRFLIKSFRLLHHILNLVCLFDNFSHVSIVAIEVGFCLVALICFRLYLNEFYTILLLLSAKLLLKKSRSKLLDLAFGSKMRLFFNCNLFECRVQFLLLCLQSLFMLRELHLHLLLK